MESRIQTGALLALAIIATGATLHWLRPVMIPFVLALFISFALALVVDWLRSKLKIPRTVALLAAFVLGLGGLALTAGIVSISAAQVGEYVDQFKDVDVRAEVDASFDQVKKWVEEGPLSGVLPDNLLPEALVPDEIVKLIPFDSLVGQVRSGLLLALGALLNLLSQSVLVLIFVGFILTGETAAPSEGTVFAEIERQIQRYVAQKTALSALTGFLVWAVLALLGVDFALALGFIAFVLNFVPTVGSIFATLLIVPAVVVQQDLSITLSILAVALPATIQGAVGNVLEPKMMGESLGLHPITILLALIFWSTLWGFMGALLATPMTAVMKLMLAQLEPTKPLAELMAGRLSADAAAPAPEPEPEPEPETEPASERAAS